MEERASRQIVLFVYFWCLVHVVEFCSTLLDHVSKNVRSWMMDKKNNNILLIPFFLTSTPLGTLSTVSTDAPL